MATQGDLGRKVRQLDNDVVAIYEMLGEIRGTQIQQGLRLDEIAGIQETHSGTLAGHTATLAGHTATLAGHTATLAGHTATLDAHTAKLDEILDILRSDRR